MLQIKNIQYQDAEIPLVGSIVYPAKVAADVPAVMVVHDWSGKNDFAMSAAKRIAELGYIGFAVDMYGHGKIGHTIEEKSALMQPLVNNRAKILKRLQIALQTVREQEQVNKQKIAAIGFCFGGLCCLDLARAGTDFSGVASFHALLNAPETTPKKILAKILLLHGYKDPNATPDQFMAFAKEMHAVDADWQANVYGRAVHAFSNPSANDKQLGLLYDAKIAERAWTDTAHFLQEIFAN